MTPEILEYLLRATVIWLALLAYYFVAGRKASFRFQRFFLLGGWLFGLLVPLLPGLVGEVSLPVANLPTISFAGPAVMVPTVEVEVGSSWQFTDFLPWLYVFGVLIFGARPLVQGWLTEQYLRTGQRSTFSGYPVIRHERIRSPFAARGHVFLPAGMTDAGLENTALIHETSHLRARHHYDKTLLTLGSILLWFHPLTWAYRRLLATVHEYEADAAVLQSVPARTYGLQLLHCSLGPTGSLGLFSSPLKQRIEMITDKSNRYKTNILAYLALPLLLATLVVACSDAGESLAISEETFSPVPVLHLSPTAEVDEYPRLINGPDEKPAERALLEAIYKEIRYPAKARKMDYTGGVRATMLIGADGKINGEITMYRELSREELANSPKHLVITAIKPEKTEPLPDNVSSSVLVEEVSRTMEALGPFKPVTAKGKPTAVVLELDFIFKLEE